MSGCSIKLEAGKRYVSRAGDIYGPMVHAQDGRAYCFLFEGECWLPDGRYYRDVEIPLDLVRECVEPVAQDTAPAADPVNHPSHYASGAVECIDAIQASMSVEAFRGYCKGSVQKYVWRYEEKGGAESLRKAEWYLKRLIETFTVDDTDIFG